MSSRIETNPFFCELYDMYVSSQHFDRVAHGTNWKKVKICCGSRFHSMVALSHCHGLLFRQNIMVPPFSGTRHRNKSDKNKPFKGPYCLASMCLHNFLETLEIDSIFAHCDQKRYRLRFLFLNTFYDLFSSLICDLFWRKFYVLVKRMYVLKLFNEVFYRCAWL